MVKIFVCLSSYRIFSGGLIRLNFGIVNSRWSLLLQKLRTHKLNGELKGSWAFNINNNYRIVFEFIDNNTVLLIDIGTHNEVY